MEDRSHYTNIIDSSYHFADVPLKLQKDFVSMDVDDCSNSNSEVDTTSSDDTVAHLEELYSDVVKEKKDIFVLLHPVSFNEEESDGTILMLESFNDDGSFNSSMMSFDNNYFSENELADGKSKP